MLEVEIVKIEDALQKPLDITAELARSAGNVLQDFCKTRNGCSNCEYGKEPQCPFGTPFLWHLGGTQ